MLLHNKPEMSKPVLLCKLLGNFFANCSFIRIFVDRFISCALKNGNSLTSFFIVHLKTGNHLMIRFLCAKKREMI